MFKKDPNNKRKKIKINREIFPKKRLSDQAKKIIVWSSLAGVAIIIIGLCFGLKSTSEPWKKFNTKYYKFSSETKPVITPKTNSKLNEISVLDFAKKFSKSKSITSDFFKQYFDVTNLIPLKEKDVRYVFNISVDISDNSLSFYVYQEIKSLDISVPSNIEIFSYTINGFKPQKPKFLELGDIKFQFVKSKQYKQEKSMSEFVKMINKQTNPEVRSLMLLKDMLVQIAVKKDGTWVKGVNVGAFVSGNVEIDKSNPNIIHFQVRPWNLKYSSEDNVWIREMSEKTYPAFIDFTQTDFSSNWEDLSV